MQFYNTVLLALLVVHGKTSPVIIRSGLGKFDEHNAAGGGSKVGSHTGAVTFDGASGYDKSGEKKFASAEDAGKYAEQQHKKNEKSDQGGYDESKYHKQNGDSYQKHDKKEGHKKGHENSGFRNTYHKDESGSKSSYWDSSNSEGDEQYHVNKNNAYGDAANRHQKGHHHNEEAYNKGGAKQGHYNNGGNYHKDHGDESKYHKNRYHDDHRDSGRNNVASRHGDAGRRYTETYSTPAIAYGGNRYPQTYNEPAYFQPSYEYPYQPYENSKITVYEDPAYAQGRRYGYDNYARYYDEGLDVRPPTAQPYYERYYQYPGYENNYYY